MVAQLGLVKILPQAGAQGGDHRLELVVAVDLVRPGLLHIEHLTPERQNGLETGIPPLLGGAPCGVALHDINFRQRRVALIAVGQLAGEGGALQGVLSADALPGLAGGLPGPVGHQRLFQNGLSHAGVLVQELLQLVAHYGVDQGAHLAVAKLRLGLALELGLGELDGDHAGQALPAVVAGHLLLPLEYARLLAVGIEHIGERPLQPLLVHTALGGVDVVGEGHDDLIVAVLAVLHGDLRHGIVLGARHVDHAVVEGRLILVDEGDKLPDAPLVVHELLRLPARAAVGHQDAHPGVQKRLLPHPAVEGLIVVDGGFKHLRVRLEQHLRTRLVGGPHDGHFLGDIPPGELHLIDLPVLIYPNLHPLAQGVDHAAADAVEAAGHLISAAAELAAGVQDGIHHLQGGLPRLGLYIHRDAPAVVRNPDGVVLQNLHGDVVAVARQGLVDGVVHNLVHQMVQARGRRGADIHARALTHGFQPLQHLDLRRAVLVGGLGGVHLIQFAAFFCHDVPPLRSSNLESAFTAETARWPRDFPDRQGKFSQEYLGLFQENLTPHTGKTPGQTGN